jgi:hypothetical protein
MGQMSSVFGTLGCLCLWAIEQSFWKSCQKEKKDVHSLSPLASEAISAFVRIF